MSVQFQSDTIIVTSNLVVSRFGGKASASLVDKIPGVLSRQFSMTQ